MLPPKYVTKYFAKGLKERVLAGGFKIGTLKEYRSYEHKVARMSDIYEGVRILRTKDTSIPEMSGANFKISGIDCRGLDTSHPKFEATIEIRRKLDAWVFCCTSGDYDEHIHKQIVDAGNDDLAEFVVLDLEKFVRGILSAANKCCGNAITDLYGNYVTYGNRSQYMDSNTLKRTVENTLTLELSEFEKIIYTKPDVFSHEREFRLFFLHQGVIPPAGLAAIFPESLELKSSIVRHS